MKCFRCGEQETALGQILCNPCRGIQEQWEVNEQQREVVKQERWRKCTYTWLFICSTCNTEVYRRAHVPRRRNRKREQEMNQQGRFALFQHVQKMQHAARLYVLQINDLSGDDEYEVPAMGLPEDRCPRYMQASTVLHELGGG